MDVEITIDDPGAYMKPWSFPLQFEFLADTKLMEDIYEKDWFRLIAFAPNASKVAAVGLQSALIWKLDGKRRPVKIKVDGGTPFTAARFTPDARTLVLRVYETAKGDFQAFDAVSGKPVEVTEALIATLPRDRGLRRGSARWLPTADHDSVDVPESKRRLELTLASGATGEPIAWWPMPYGAIDPHPGGRIWSVRRGAQLILFALEGNPA